MSNCKLRQQSQLFKQLINNKIFSNVQKINEEEYSIGNVLLIPFEKHENDKFKTLKDLFIHDFYEKYFNCNIDYCSNDLYYSILCSILMKYKFVLPFNIINKDTQIPSATINDVPTDVDKFLLDCINESESSNFYHIILNSKTDNNNDDDFDILNDSLNANVDNYIQQCKKITDLYERDMNIYDMLKKLAFHFIVVQNVLKYNNIYILNHLSFNKDELFKYDEKDEKCKYDNYDKFINEYQTNTNDNVSRNISETRYSLDNNNRSIYRMKRIREEDEEEDDDFNDDNTTHNCKFSHLRRNEKKHKPNHKMSYYYNNDIDQLSMKSFRNPPPRRMTIN